MKRLYLVGFDSVPLWILEELRHEKGLEVFNWLFEKSVLTDMESTLPPMSGPAWPTIYTGLEPSEHGVPDFFVMKKDYVPDIVLYDSSVAPFWKKLAEEGKRCLLITPVEETNPDYPKNIDIITGFPLPAKTNSKKLGRLMKKYGFVGEPDIEKNVKAGKMTELEAIKIFVNSIRERSEIAKQALEDGYDFAFVCFTETDRIQHFLLNKSYWKSRLKPIYVEYAKFLEYIIDRVDREGSAMVLVSDHGSQPIYKKFLINCWLVHNGYLKIKDSVREGMETGQSGKDSRLYTIRERLLKTKLRRFYDRLPYKMKRLAFEAAGVLLPGASTGTYTRLHLFDYDMRGSVVFAAISNDPVTTLWINDSRFVNPAVQKKDREKVKKGIMAKLRLVKGPDGEPMFTRVIDGDSYYGKTDKFIAPDIIVEARPNYTIDIFNYSSKSFFMDPENAKGGDHSRFGIFGYYPKSLGIDARGINVRDVSGIILRYFRLNGKSIRMKTPG